MNWRYWCNQGAFATPKLQIGGILLICMEQDALEKITGNAETTGAFQNIMQPISSCHDDAIITFGSQGHMKICGREAQSQESFGMFK